MFILADSCCDLSPELRERTGALTAPLTITISGKDYIDDGSIDIPAFIDAMKASSEPGRSACPSPDQYEQLINAQEGDCFIVTLSSNLSGSYNAAALGAQLAQETKPGRRIHIVDSESASAGETFLALMIRDLIDAGRSFEEIVELVTEKMRTMNTIFVLDSLDNLVKNGRVSKAVATVAGLLSIRLVMSDDGHGRIKQLGKARGIKAALSSMVDVCRKHTEGSEPGSRRLVLSYCNCPERAALVRDMIRAKCPAIGEIIMTPTSGLSSMYAYDGGVVIAY
ncbi:MAG: DegV family protein [Clostridia bacterium]|nr:DegV family protein [Clostridia bacterium]